MARRYRGPFEPFDPGSFEGGFRELHIPRPPRRFWIGLAFVVAAILVIALTAPLVNALTEVQWFTALGLRGVYVTRFFLQFWLFLAGLGAGFLFSAANVVVALRNRTGRVLRAVGIRRRVVRTAAGAIGLGASAAIALILAGPLGGNWQHLALFLHPVATGTRDPVFGLDVSFYLLTLPFLHDLLGWLTGLFFLVALLIAGLYAWRGDTFDLRLPPRALAHLSVLLGGIALVLSDGVRGPLRSALRARQRGLGCRLHGRPRAALDDPGPDRAGGPAGAGSVRQRGPTAAPADRRGDRRLAGHGPGLGHLSRPGPADRGPAGRALPGIALHLARDLLHPGGVRPGPGQDGVVRRRRPGHAPGDRAGPGHHQQPPSLGQRPDPGDLPAAPVAAHLLHVPAHRRRPVRHQWADRPAGHQRPRAGPEPASPPGAELVQPEAHLHARVRRGRQPRQHSGGRGPARLRGRRHPPHRPPQGHPPADLLRRVDRQLRPGRHPPARLRLPQGQRQRVRHLPGHRGRAPERGQPAAVGDAHR